MDLKAIMARFYPVPENSEAVLASKVSLVAYPKGFRLVEAGRIEPCVYFIKKGLVRAYSDMEDREVTFWFGKEGDTVISMRSYVTNQPGYEHVELLEDSELYRLESRHLKELFAADIHIANFGRRLAEEELVRTEERLISMQFTTALERYRELISTNPDLLQRVQLGHIASYLGITQVSLSRIRAVFR
jgi:CRP-like cAMP-binding protein